MLGRIYDSVERRISIWLSLVFFLILICLYFFFESGSAFGQQTTALFVGQMVIAILAVQLITFAFSHRLFVFAFEKASKKKPAMNKYYAMVLFNYCLFSFAFFLLFMAFWGQGFIPSNLYDSFVLIPIIASVPFFALTLAFNIILMKKIFTWNYPSAFAGFLAVAVLTAILYLINPFGFWLYVFYLVLG